MRKRNIKYLFDKLFWWSLMALPIIGYILINTKIMGSIGTNELNMISLYNYIAQSAWGYLTENLIWYNPISSMLNIMGMTADKATTLTIILSWALLIEIVHVLYDFLAFIPRLCHKFMECFTQNKD